MANDDKRISQAEQARIERQNEGYDEAARGGKGVPPTDVGVPLDPDYTPPIDDFDREAAEAANDVRREDHSAD